MKLVVDILAGARAGQRLTLDCVRPVRFGRAPDNEVAFDPERDRDASGRHAELRLEGGQLWIYDLGSANGTRLDGELVRRAPVPPGSELEFGAGGPKVAVSYESDAYLASTLEQPRAGGSTGVTGPQAVGPRTVAVMIERAMSRARLRMLALVAAALLVTTGSVVAAYRLHPRSVEALRQKMVQLMDEQRAASDSERARLQKRIDELAGQLGRAQAKTGADIARANHDAIYLVVVRAPSRLEDSFCTAFAVSADKLVTNAHCVVLAEELRHRGGQIFAVQNGHPEMRLPVVRGRRVAGFVPSADHVTPDVGWMQVEGVLGTPVTLATRAEYEALATGDPMFTYGFPGRLADAAAPEATFVAGVVGRVTTVDGRSGDVGQRQLVQHSAFTSGGTSGSPIFNAAGHVVAVNTGGYLGDTKQALAGYNFGMRIDLAGALLSEADQ